MVHLDAHPDMSASTTMPAQLIMEEPQQAVWSFPKQRLRSGSSQVYDLLRDDPSGIAQWILPAAYAGHLNCVWSLGCQLSIRKPKLCRCRWFAPRWLRPEWARQIADGDYRGAQVACDDGDCQRIHFLSLYLLYCIIY